MKTYTAADYLCSCQRFRTFIRVIISIFVTCPKFSKTLVPIKIKLWGSYNILWFQEVSSWGPHPWNEIGEAEFGYKNLLHSFFLGKIASSLYLPKNIKSEWLIQYDVNLFLSDLCIFVSVFIQFLHASGLPAMISIELNSTVLGVKHVRAIFELEILKILPMSRFWAWITS